MSEVIKSDLKFDYIEYKGLSIRYATRSAGKDSKPLLMLNGIGQSIEILEPVIDALEQYYVIAIDVPGTGKSDTPKFPWLMKQHADLVAHLLTELGIERTDVMGFSWGGILARFFCRYHSTKANRLILAASPPGYFMFWGSPGVYLRMMNPRRFHQKGYMRSIAPFIYGGDVRHSFKVVDQNASRLIPPSSKGYIFQALSSYGTAPLFWVSKLRQSTLILQGVDDPMVPNINALIEKKLFADSKLEFFGCGHLFMLTRLDEMVPKINEFLAA